MSRQFVFFAYLLESYAAHTDTSASAVLATLDAKGLTSFVYDMYELYHTESIENAFMDLESLISNGRPAW